VSLWPAQTTLFDCAMQDRTNEKIYPMGHLASYKIYYNKNGLGLKIKHNVPKQN
jgi:hypothetical protein